MAKINLNFIALQLKKNLLSLFFWLKLFLIIIFIYLVKQINLSSSEDSLVLLLNENSQYGDEIIDSIANSSYEGFRFEKSSDLNSSKSRVQKNEAVAAVVFTDDFDFSVQSGKLNNSIKFYQSAASIDGYAVKEVIFPFILQAASNTLLKQYISSTSPNADEQSQIYVSKLNDAISKGMDISIFRVEDCNSQNDNTIISTNNLPYNIALWLIFALSLVDVYGVFEELKAYLFAKRPLIRLFFPLEAALISSSIISLAVGIIFFTSKAYIFLLYGICCSLYSYLIKTIIRNNRVFSVIIPILILLCLLVCPVIYDFSLLIPGIGYLGKLLPITYFILP